MKARAICADIMKLIHAKFTARSKWGISDVTKVQISQSVNTSNKKRIKGADLASYTSCNVLLSVKTRYWVRTRMQSATLLFTASVLTLAGYSTGVTVQLSCDSQLRLVLPQLFTHCSRCSYSEWSAWEAVPNSVVRVRTSQCRSNESYNETRTQSAVGQGCRSRTQTRSVCKWKNNFYIIDQSLLVSDLISRSHPLSTFPQYSFCCNNYLLPTSWYSLQVLFYSFSLWLFNTMAGMPDREDRLIMALGLGSTGHDYSSTSGPIPPLRPLGPVVQPLSLSFRNNSRGRRSVCLNNSAICHDYTEPRGKRNNM